MSNSIWKTPDQKPEENKLIFAQHDRHRDGNIDYFIWDIHEFIDAIRKDSIRWCYLDDLIAQADNAERLQVELDETKKALLRDFEIRNDCLIKILESYLNFAGLVRAYPKVPALPTFRAGNIIYDWSPVLELMKNGRTDRALERLKAIEPGEICPKCGKEMTETMLLSLPPQTQYRCGKCGYIEINKRTYTFSADGEISPMQEKIVDDILSKIPAGRRYESMERLDTKDGETIVRIHTKRDDDE